MIKLSSLKLNKTNPRFIRDDKFHKLVKSVQEFPAMMVLRPIVVDNDGIILGGNMRYRACLELGIKEVPDEWVRKASDLTDAEKKRFIIEDNVEFGGWDYVMLANEWNAAELEEWGLDIGTWGAEGKINEQQEWEGMPEYENAETTLYVTVKFITEEDREQFLKKYEFKIAMERGAVKSFWWPYKEREDKSSLKYEA